MSEFISKRELISIYYIIHMFSNSISAMNSDAVRMSVSAHRVANVNTPEMKPPVDLAEERIAQITAENDFEANASVIKTQDEMLGELIDLVV